MAGVRAVVVRVLEKLRCADVSVVVDVIAGVLWAVWLVAVERSAASACGSW